MLQNPVGETGQLFFNFGAPAALNTTMSLAPGQWVQFDRPCAVPGEALHVLAGDTGHAFVLLVGQRAGIE